MNAEYDYDEDEYRPWWRRYAPAAVIVVVAALIGVGMWSMIDTKGGRQKPPEVVKLRIIQPPPPPPPPPPPQRKIEPPKMKMKQPEFRPLEPQQAKAPPPPGPPALDAKGAGPGDAFGLEGREGGSEWTGGGDGSGGTGNGYGWYATVVQQRAQGAVEKQRKLREARFQVKVQLWLGPDGKPERVELVRSTGNEDIDRLLISVLGAMPKLPDPPPKDMPQPVVLRVSTS